MAELPLTSSHWGTYRVEAADGVVKALHPFEHDPDPSPIGPGIVDVLTGPTRVTEPMIRKSWLEHGPGAAPELRGREPFVAVDWSTANRLVAAELDRVRTDYGNESIFAGSYGWASAGRFHHAQSQLRRFLNCIGGHTRSLNTYSFAAGEVVVPHVLGGFREFVYGEAHWDDVIESGELVVAFGGVPLKNSQISQGGVGSHAQRDHVLAAAEAGIDFVNISPMRSDVMAEANADWLAARPSTDAAILIGLAHTLVVEELADRSFLDRYTTGFDRYEAYLLGETDGVAKSAAWAGDISGLGTQVILDLARRMASNRTMLSVSWSMTRQDHGEQPFWAAIALASMLGKIGVPGQGLAFGYSAMNSVGNRYARMPVIALPQGTNEVDRFIPVARISDMLLNPGQTFEYNGGTYTYPDARVVWWAGGNPFHHHQDLNRMLEAWRRPDTIIVNEWCWNAQSKHADVVLPVNTTLEREDIAMAGLDPFIVKMDKVIESAGESRSDHEIFRGLAAELGVEMAFTEGRTEREWLEWIYAETKRACAGNDLEIPTLAELERDGWFEVKVPQKQATRFEQFRADPDASPLRTPSGKIEIFSETIDGFRYDDCVGHPAWYEPYEWLGEQVDGALHLVSNQPTRKLHSQLDHGNVSRAGKVDGREPLTMHPDDAAARSLSDGDVVRVFNERGACLASVVVDDVVRPSVVQISTGAWFDPADADGMCKHGNPNAVTRDKGTSRLAQGPTAHTCMVQVERYEGEPPPVTAFEPPVIERPGAS